MIRHARTLFALATVAAPALAGGVRIVDPSGARNFPDLHSAVTAANDGDVLLVGEGRYPAFSFHGKSLSIVAAEGAHVVVTGPISIQLVGASQRVLLSGLDVQVAGFAPANAFLPALSLIDCAGQVSLEQCRFQAEDRDFNTDCSQHQGFAASPGVAITNSARVSFHECQILGGRGDSTPAADACACGSGASGVGMLLDHSSVSLYNAVVRGGAGPEHPCGQGHGATGLEMKTASFVFAAGAAFVGGAGGASTSCPGSSGGDGVIQPLDCNLALTADTLLLGGDGGVCSGGSAGPAGQPISGNGITTYLGEETRRALMKHRIVSDNSRTSVVAFPVSVFERGYFLESTSSEFLYAPQFNGLWLVPRSKVRSVTPMSPAPVLTAVVNTGDLTGGDFLQHRYAQTVVRTPTGLILGSPAQYFVLDRASGPDCNANGVNDYLDVLEGLAADANHNLIPDGCPGG